MTGLDEQRRTAFGLELRIDSRIPIAELGLGAGAAAMRSPSHVRLDEAELDRRWSALGSRPVRTREVSFGETLLRTVDFAEEVGHLLWVHGCGRVLVSPDGLELLCAPDATNEDWASIVTSQALPLAATIRGLEVMHASGVVLDGGAMLFVGPSGAGKSSLAAALLRCGGRLLSDDAVALASDGSGLVAHPGSTALQVRRSEDARLAEDERTQLGQPAGWVDGRRRYVIADVADVAPLTHVFLLERSDADPIVEPLEAVDPFELIGGTFNVSVRSAERLQRQLDLVSAIASSGLAHRLRVHDGVNASALAELVREFVRADIARRRLRTDAGPSGELPAEL